MLGIMLQKMWHKKWMNLSLLLGCILLVATAVSFPLYQEAVYDRMLNDEFDHAYASTGEWPSQISVGIVSKKERDGATIRSVEEFIPKFYSDLGVKEKETAYYYVLFSNGIHSELNRNDADELRVRIGMKTNLQDHARIVSGEMYSESGYNEDGAIEVVISQSCFVKQGYLVGETIIFDNLKDYDGNPIKLYIKGVFEKNEDDGSYWQEKNDEFNDVCLMNPDLFREMFTGEKAIKYSMNCYYYAMFEYEDIAASRVEHLKSWTEYYTGRSPFRSVIKKAPYADVLTNYTQKISRISATMTLLQIPVLIMLAAFLLMISGQMYEMERNEISVIKSRGSSRSQIFRLYLYQGIVLTLGGALGGVPLGMLLSRMLGATRNFLIFDFSEKLDVHFTQKAGIYMLAAMLLGLICLTVPAIKHSKVSIVNLKQQKALKKKSLWEKLFVDVVCIAVAGYGYYNFHRNSSDMAQSVLNGKALDPLLYLSSSLMIIGLGLLFLRLQPLILKLIYTLGKKAWKPASFVSFMENVKNGRKQQLIMLFLIMTVSLGMYHSTVARTIVENAVKNTEYSDGCDIILKEVWTAVTDSNGVATGEYIEPDSEKYIKTDIFDSYTRVYNINNVEVAGGTNGKFMANLMGINTKQFGEITYVDKNLNKGLHYYTLLNELAPVENGVLVSSDFRDKLGFKVGDNVIFTYGKKTAVSGVIIDFFDYFPTYAQTTSVMQPDGNISTESNYLIVAHYEYLREKYGDMPYEIWGGLRDGVDERDIYEWIKGNDVRLTKYINRDKNLEETRSDPLLQGTNGILTLGFVVTLLLCGVGYLIYWIMALKERELVFGVLRASGFHKGELFHMLINEQVFCGFFSIAAGFGIGKLTSVLFVPMLQKAYASTTQVLPLLLITNDMDTVRLIAVITGMMTVCLVTLTVMLFRMNVTKALKLGEE